MASQYFLDETPKDEFNRLIDLYDTFLSLRKYIIDMKKDDKDLILKSNFLINILYMYLDNKNIDISKFLEIVDTCRIFDINIANDVFKELKVLKPQYIKIAVNSISIENYENLINGEETISIEYVFSKIKIKTLAKYINWYLGDKLYKYLKTEDFTLCFTFPENCKCNRFTLGDIGDSANDFFEKMITSKPMKQAMIIDNEAIKYKYLFDNKDILKEFNKNVHLVPLPFKDYFGYTDKKSFDIYISTSYKIDNNFIKMLGKYNFFFVSKAHEYKHASRIYLRIYDKNTGIKTPQKNVTKLEGYQNYVSQIFEQSYQILNTLLPRNFTKEIKDSKAKVNEYGELLEISLFGYKLDDIFLHSLIFCLSESSWELSPEKFYHNFKKSMLNENIISLRTSCNKGFLKSLYEFYDFLDKDKNYSNIILSKDSDSNSEKNISHIHVKRMPHLGLKDINRGKKTDEILSVEELNKRKSSKINSNEDENEVVKNKDNSIEEIKNNEDYEKDMN